MRAIVCTEYGAPERLQLAERPEPRPDAGEVLIATSAVGLGYVDMLHVAGRYQVKWPLPFVPGSEICGTVVGLGAGVEDLPLGQRIFGFCEHGALAERVLLPRRSCVPAPAGLDDVQTASFPISYGTALYGLRECGRLQPGETVLVLGAGGGVAGAAIDVALAMGAQVIAAAASPAKRELALARGARAAVDYTQADWRESLKTVSGGCGVDLVFDPVGGAFSEAAFRTLAPGGRHLVVGFAAGEIPRLPFNLPLLKRAALIGVDWGGAQRADRSIALPVFRQLIEWIAAGRIRPQAGEVYPLERTGEALGAMLRRESRGKVVITLRL
jgi:NADPH2:quinone reductase